jgi:hypothetical protein
MQVSNGVLPPSKRQERPTPQPAWYGLRARHMVVFIEGRAIVNLNIDGVRDALNTLFINTEHFPPRIRCVVLYCVLCAVCCVLC